MLLAAYYAWYCLIYLRASVGYAMGDAAVIERGRAQFPVMAARDYPPKKQALRLAQVALLAGATGYCLWAHPWVGIALALYVSGYEVYMSWGFYRRAGTLTTNEGMTRLTVHAAMCGFLLTEAAYGALRAGFPQVGS